MVELIHSAQSFMNAEDAIIAKKKKKGERLENGYIHLPEQGSCPKKAKVGVKRIVNTSPDQVLMQIKDNLSLKWPEMMKGNPNK